MFYRELEFRGIHIQHLQMYLEELGGKGITLQQQFPRIFRGENWSAAILNEEELTFTSVFKVNAVQIRFEAIQEEKLEEIIQKFRLKTTRIGG